MSTPETDEELQDLFKSRVESRGLAIADFAYTKIAEVHPSISANLESPLLPLLSACLRNDAWYVIATRKIVVCVDGSAKKFDCQDVDTVSDLSLSLNGDTNTSSMCLTLRSGEKCWLEYEAGDAAEAIREALGMVSLADVEPWIRKPFPNFGPEDETRVAVRDLDRAKQFYVTKLGCHIVDETDTSVRIEGEILAGRCTLRLACRGEWPAAYSFPVFYMTRFLGGVRDLHGHFVAMGIDIIEPLEQEETRKGPTSKFAINDPDGNFISFSGPP